MKKTITLAGLLVWCFTSCEHYLDKKSDMSLAIPSSVKDLQAIMDFELNSVVNYPMAGDVGSDYHYVNDTRLHALPVRIQEGYLFTGTESYDADWIDGYKKIFNANLVIEQIDKVKLNGLNEVDRDRVKGTAYFMRGWSLLTLAIIYAPAVDEKTADNRLGLPLRTTADINVNFQRATLKETFLRITDDLKTAASLLPHVAVKPTRPSRGAAYGALARTYLYMGDNQLANLYADSCLQINSSLIDYAGIDTAAIIPFSQFNDEVILHNTMIANNNLFSDANVRVDSILYTSYLDSDLRKRVLYKKMDDGGYAFKGNYSGINNSLIFSGITVSEIFLIKAESASRLGLLEQARDYLRTFLEHRYTSDQIPDTGLPQQDLISFVLEERKKELAFRAGIRWGDIKRLNEQYDARISLRRKVEGNFYDLSAGDNRFVYLIPRDVIQLGGLIQNDR